MENAERAPTTADGDVGDERFSWHPEYRGQSVAEVRQRIHADVAHDQRAYTLAMEGAEEAEHASLSAVIDLEKKWGAYNLDWASADADVLADEIVAFERERDRRRELISYREYRHERAATPPARAIGGMTTGTSNPGIRWGAALVILVIVVVVLLLLLS